MPDDDRTRELDISALVPGQRPAVTGGMRTPITPGGVPVSPESAPTVPTSPEQLAEVPARFHTGLPSRFHTDHAPGSAAPTAGAHRPPEPDGLAADETMLLPIYVTGPAGGHGMAGSAGRPGLVSAVDSEAGPPAETADEEPAPVAPPRIPQPVADDRLPSDERNMLIFVTILLALGTLAIVAMASVGR